MTGDGKEKEIDLRTRYEFLIAGIVAILLCIFAFAAFRITNYLNGLRSVDNSETTIGANDGTVLIEVEIRETSGTDETAAETSETGPDPDTARIILNEHDDIHIFTVTETGNNYYKSKAGRLNLFSEPKETGEDIPSLIEDAFFEVLGFSRDGWAAIDYGGQRYYVKSADIVQTDAPEDAAEKHKEPKDSQSVRFFTPNSGDVEYVVTMNTKAFTLPDVMSSGNSIDLQNGERVIVTATGGNWFKIIYMNAEYYMLGYLQSRADFTRNDPDAEITDNTGYPEAGTAGAAISAIAAGAADTATSAGTSSSGEQPYSTETTETTEYTEATEPSDPNEYSDPYEAANATAPEGYARDILTLTNAERQRVGVAPLVWDTTLAYCASVRAAELPLLTYEQNRNHLRPDGSEWYTVNEEVMYAENIAYGQRSEEQVFNEWLNSSSGHYEHMIDPDYKTFAVALYVTDSGYSYYWIEEFGY